MIAYRSSSYAKSRQSSCSEFSSRLEFVHKDWIQRLQTLTMSLKLWNIQTIYIKDTMKISNQQTNWFHCWHGSLEEAKKCSKWNNLNSSTARWTLERFNRAPSILLCWNNAKSSDGDFPLFLFAVPPFWNFKLLTYHHRNLNWITSSCRRVARWWPEKSARKGAHLNKKWLVILSELTNTFESLIEHHRTDHFWLHAPFTHRDTES